MSSENEIICARISREDIYQASQEDPNLIEFIRENVLIKGPALHRYKLDSPFLRDVSQFSEGVMLEEYFGKKKYGTFIEAGALDGETYSNTLLLERVHRWSGLLVEPNPENFNKLLSKGRHALSSQCCLSSTQTHSRGLISIDDEYSSMINETNSDRNVHQFAEVDCFPLYAMMVSANLTTVDLLALDMEGVELKVLKSLPWEKVNIRSILIEHKHIPEGKEYLRTFLQSKNYELVTEIEIDYFFAKKD